MKSNIIIMTCVICLVALAVILAVLTLGTGATAVAHTESSAYSWYFKPREDGLQPICADDAAGFIDNYDALYLGDAQDKSIYLTFDAGYESGDTEAILDALKEAGAPAAFFVTGHYMESNPQLIRRMADEGHLVCNHTVNHKDMTKMTSAQEFSEELNGLAEKYKEITGKEMPKYVRPPEGRYSEQALKMCQNLGYTTVFWSFAYKDWLKDDQPDTQAAIDRIMRRTHSGEVVLLHSTSTTNAKIMPDILAKWKEQGYTFKSLDDLKQAHMAAALQSASPSPSPAE